MSDKGGSFVEGATNPSTVKRNKQLAVTGQPLTDEKEYKNM